MAHVSLASIQPSYKRGVGHVSLVCHAPFISDYSRTSKCLLTSTRDVALEQYCTSSKQQTVPITLSGFSTFQFPILLYNISRTIKAKDGYQKSQRLYCWLLSHQILYDHSYHWNCMITSRRQLS